MMMLANLDRLSDGFIEAIDALTEKASAKRIEALSSISKLMKLRYTITLLENQLEALVGGVIQCINKASSTEEFTKAFGVLALVSATVGPCELPGQRSIRGSQSLNATNSSVTLSAEMTSRMKEVLIRYADAAMKKSAEVRCAAINALSIIQFMDSTAEDLILEKSEDNPLIMLKNWWNDVDVSASAIDAWSFVSTIIPYKYKINLLIPQALTSLKDKITSESTSPAVKIAAGQAVALLFEAVHNSEDIDMDTVIPRQSYDDLLTAMNKIASVSTKSISKKNKSAQKASYRNFIDTVECGEAPSEKLNVSGSTLAFESWDKLIQLSTFKHLLESGTLEHFKFNTNLQSIFGVSDLELNEPNTTKLSSIEKKYYLSKNSDFNKNDTLEKNKLTRQFAHYVQNEDE